jgi:copper(I)-binding protein
MSPAHGELSMNDAVSRRQALRLGLLALGAAMLAPRARACEFFALNLRVTHPWTRVTAADAPFAIVCMKIDQVRARDRLIGVETPVATSAQIGGISTGVFADRVKNLPNPHLPMLNLPIEPGQDLIMSEAGVHVRLLGLTQPLLIGRSYPMRLVFEKSGPLEAELNVDYES